MELKQNILILSLIAITRISAVVEYEPTDYLSAEIEVGDLELQDACTSISNGRKIALLNNTYENKVIYHYKNIIRV